DRQYTGQRREIGLGLYDYNARYYDPLLGRFLSADSIVPSPANPQTLNRYAYVLNNPMKYRDPDGHNPLPFLIVLAAAAVVRVGSEYAVSRVPWMDRARRDQLGGGLVTDVADEIERESALHSVDATLVSAVLRHESAAVERRALTIWPIFQPNIIANAAEGVQSLLPTGWSMSNLRFGEMASLGPGQMQLRRARELEELGYVTPRNGDGARRAALLGRETSVEYVAGMLHYLSDQLSTVEGFSTLSVEQQHRLILIGYVWGWTDQFQTLLHEKGLAWMIENGGYDKTTLDEYLRWSSGQ
ncbi:MAG: RHS repeat-associated core domain-containing protein, partial [Anaerolineae bacterium]